MTPTPCKQDVIALAERLEKFQCVLESAQRQDNKIISVWSDDPVVVAEAVQTLRHLASQSSSYEAGLRDMRERCEDEARRQMRIDTGGGYYRAQTIADAIAALPADGGANDIQSSDGGVEESPASTSDYNGVKSPALVTAHGLSRKSCPLSRVAPGPSETIPYGAMNDDPSAPGYIATPSTAGSVREAMEKAAHDAGRETARKLLSVKDHTFSPDYLAMAIVQDALKAVLAISAPVEDPAAVKAEELADLLRDHIEYGYEGAYDRCQKVIGFDEAARALLEQYNIRSALIATPRPLPSVEQITGLIRENCQVISDDERVYTEIDGIDEAATDIRTLLGGSAHG